MEAEKTRIATHGHFPISPLLRKWPLNYSFFKSAAPLSSVPVRAEPGQSFIGMRDFLPG
jgi:hypothetical protein